MAKVSEAQRTQIEQYLNLGLRLVRHLPDKRPVDAGWNASDGPQVTPKEAAEWLEQGNMLGVVVPEGFVVLDVDKPEPLEWLEGNGEQDIPEQTPIQRTQHGYHLWFRLPPGVDIPPATDVLTAGGVPHVTYRSAQKSSVIVSPSPGRKWKTPLPPYLDMIPAVPASLLPAHLFERPAANGKDAPAERRGRGRPRKAPADGPTKATDKAEAGFLELCRCVHWAPGQGDGNDVELAITGAGVQSGLSDEAILEGLRVVFGEEFSEVRSRQIIELTRTKAEAGEALPGMRRLLKLAGETPDVTDDGEDAGRSKRDALALRLARQIIDEASGSLVLLHPAETVKDLPTLGRVTPEGACRPIDGDTLARMVDGAAGAPQEAAIACRAQWYLGTLLPRQASVRHDAVAFIGGWYDGATGEIHQGKPPVPCRFYVPRRFITPENGLPELEDLQIVKDLQAAGVRPEDLLDMGARVVTPGPAEAVYLMLGPGGSGKSTIANLLELVIGGEHVIRQLQRAFEKTDLQKTVASLEGRLACVLDDADGDVLKDLGAFVKEVATAPTLTGRAPYQGFTTFRNATALIVLSNDAPRRVDHSRGLYDRLHVRVYGARMRYAAAGRPDIVREWAMLEDELDALFSHFLIGAALRVWKKVWPVQIDPAHAKAVMDVVLTPECRFAWQRLEGSPDAGAFVPWSDVADAWAAWWPDYSHRPTLHHERLEIACALTFGSGVKNRQKQIDGVRTRGLQGVRLIPEKVAVTLAETALEATVRGAVAEYKVHRKNHIFYKSFLGKSEKENTVEEPENNRENIERFFAENVGVLGHSADCPEWEAPSVGASADVETRTPHADPPAHEVEPTPSPVAAEQATGREEEKMAMYEENKEDVQEAAEEAVLNALVKADRTVSGLVAALGGDIARDEVLGAVARLRRAGAIRENADGLLEIV